MHQYIIEACALIVTLLGLFVCVRYASWRVIVSCVCVLVFTFECTIVSNGYLDMYYANRRVWEFTCDGHDLNSMPPQVLDLCMDAQRAMGMRIVQFMQSRYHYFAKGQFDWLLSRWLTEWWIQGMMIICIIMVPMVHVQKYKLDLSHQTETKRLMSHDLLATTISRLQQQSSRPQIFELTNAESETDFLRHGTN